MLINFFITQLIESTCLFYDLLLLSFLGHQIMCPLYFAFQRKLQRQKKTKFDRYDCFLKRQKVTESSMVDDGDEEPNTAI